MQHLAIDLGSKDSQVCIRNEVGEIVMERKVATTKLAALLSKQAQSRVVLETSAEAFFVADAALLHGHEVRVVPATLVRSLGVGERGIKTDRRDARKLSEVSTRIDCIRFTDPCSWSVADRSGSDGECVEISWSAIAAGPPQWCRAAVRGSRSARALC